MYEWVLVLHIVSVISWMAGLLYLPRLFVYHVEAKPGSELSETFKIMERRLLRAIMTPAMIASWIFGLWLAYITEAFSEGWFHGKILLVILMSAAHMGMARWRKDFERDNNARGAKYYRIANEIPTLLMIGIVVLVVVKPF
jgi:protoporphyrinogen IX oxidase